MFLGLCTKNSGKRICLQRAGRFHVGVPFRGSERGESPREGRMQGYTCRGAARLGICRYSWGLLGSLGALLGAPWLLLAGSQTSWASKTALQVSKIGQKAPKRNPRPPPELSRETWMSSNPKILKYSYPQIQKSQGAGGRGASLQIYIHTYVYICMYIYIFISTN